MNTYLKTTVLSAALTLAALCAAQSGQAQEQLFVSGEAGDIYDITIPNSGSSTVSTFASGLSGPSALAFDTTGNLFVAEQGAYNPNAGGPGIGGFNSGIYKYAAGSGGPSTASTLFAGTSGTPTALAVNGSDNLYAAANGSIYQYSSTGSVTSTLSGHAAGLAFNSGVLFASDSSNGNINTFASGATTPTNFANALSHPSALAFDPAGNDKGNLFVIENADIDEFTLNAQGQITNYSTFATGLNELPSALAFDSKGNLFVANSESGAIDEFKSTDGVLSSSYSPIATGLSFPVGMAFRPAVVPEASTLIGLGGLVLGGGLLGLRRGKSRN